MLPVSLGVHDGTPIEALARRRWEASPWYARHRRESTVRLEVLRDARDDETSAAETIRDEPITFDPARREHGWRAVVREHIDVPNPGAAGIPHHDPMGVLAGG